MQPLALAAARLVVLFGCLYLAVWIAALALGIFFGLTSR